MDRLLRVLAFSLLSASLFAIALAGASRTRTGEHTLLQELTKVTVEPGGEFQSLRRFREASAAGRVDIVFLGSSHAYRGFDPRLFAEAGLASMNLGSTNQTPLNSYFVAERWLPSLAPRLVVFELYYQSLASDGLESVHDLEVNTPSSWPMAKMAIATWDLGAMTFSVAKALRLAGDESRAEQRAIAGETYVAGGYCETVRRRAALDGRDEPIALDVSADQLAWLARATALARTAGAHVVWTSHPLPVDHVRRIAKRAHIREAIDVAAARAGVPYWDFGDSLALDPLADFFDVHHLNASGVAKYDRALLAKLADEGEVTSPRRAPP